MKNPVGNLILILGLCALAIMTVGLTLYDYIPSGLTVSKANQYEVEAKTTEALSGAKDAQELLSSQSHSVFSQSGSSSSVQSNIVYKEYSISKSDLALFKSSGLLEQGRANPFAEISPAVDDNSSGSSSDNSASNPQQQLPSDGSLFNSSYSK